MMLSLVSVAVGFALVCLTVFGLEALLAYALRSCRLQLEIWRVMLAYRHGQFVMHMLASELPGHHRRRLTSEVALLCAETARCWRVRFAARPLRIEDYFGARPYSNARLCLDVYAETLATGREPLRVMLARVVRLRDELNSSAIEQGTAAPDNPTAPAEGSD